MNMKTTVLGVLVLGLVLFGPAVESRGDPIGTAFTYQGQLKEAGNPADGPYDFVFSLYDDSEFGTLVAGPVYLDDVPVVAGLFTVQIDFGNVFNGTALWLEIRVRPGDSGGSYTPLWPRQPLTPTPYSIHATRAGTADHGSLEGLLDNDHPQYIMHDETDSVTTAMIQNQAVTREKITSDMPLTGEVLHWNGSSIVWDIDDVGDCLWQYSGDNWHIFYDEGYVGIGTADPDRTLHVVADGSGVLFDMTQSSGDVHILGSSPSDECFEVDGESHFQGPVGFHDLIRVYDDLRMPNIEVSGGTSIVINPYSDKLYKVSASLRYKSNVADLPSTGDAVLALRPVLFEWKSTAEADIGLIAEEVAEVIPDLVLYDAEGQPDAVKYDRLGVYLLQVVKSQREQIAAQEQRLERLEATMAQLTKAPSGGAR